MTGNLCKKLSHRIFGVLGSKGLKMMEQVPDPRTCLLHGMKWHFHWPPFSPLNFTLFPDRSGGWGHNLSYQININWLRALINADNVHSKGRFSCLDPSNLTHNASHTHTHLRCLILKGHLHYNYTEFTYLDIHLFIHSLRLDGKESCYLASFFCLFFFFTVITEQSVCRHGQGCQISVSLIYVYSYPSSLTKDWYSVHVQVKA